MAMGEHFERLWSKIAANFDWPSVAEACQAMNISWEVTGNAPASEELVEIARALCYEAYKTNTAQVYHGLVASYSLGRLRLHFEVDRVTAMDINGEDPNYLEL